MKKRKRRKRNPVSLALHLRAQKQGGHPNKKRINNKYKCRKSEGVE